jgi:hypothetical protein
VTGDEKRGEESGAHVHLRNAAGYCQTCDAGPVDRTALGPLGRLAANRTRRGVPVTGEAQGISEQDRLIEKVRVALDDMTMPLGHVGWESCVADLISGTPALLAALAERDRELAELRATISDVQKILADDNERSGTRVVVARERITGSAPTGQEER